MKLTTDLKKPMLVAGVMLFVALMAQYYLGYQVIYFSHFTTINIRFYVTTALYLIALVAIMHPFQKKCLSKVPGLTLPQLAAVSSLLCFGSQFLFYFVTNILEPNTIFVTIIFILVGTLSSSVYSALVAYMVALRIMRPKSAWSWLLPVLFLLAIVLFSVASRLVRGSF